MSLSTEEKQTYAEAINVLFNGAIQADADQITEEVAVAVDSMISEITKCSKQIANFGFDVIYSLTVSVALGQLIPNLIVRMGTGIAVKKLLKDWIMKLSSGYQFVGCLARARANYRTSIQLKLMGL